MHTTNAFNNHHHQRDGMGQMMDGHDHSVDDRFNHPANSNRSNNGGPPGKNSNSVGYPQQRRLIDTSNMFSVYRNSLKNNENIGNLNMSMPGTAETHADTNPASAKTSQQMNNMVPHNK